MIGFTDIVMLAILPVLLLCSAFFSGAETALFSLTRHQRLRLQQSGTLVGSTVTHLLDQERALLVSLLLGNMFVNVLYFVMGTVLVLDLHERHVVGAAVGNVCNVATVLLLILVGEVLPKLIASRYAARWSSLAALPLMLVFRALSPLRVVLQGLIVKPVSRLIEPSRKPASLSPRELQAMLELSLQHRVIDHEEEQLLQQVLSLSPLKVYDLMTPRVEIAAFDLDGDPARLCDLIRKTRFSRIPVYHNDLDHIEGIVLARHALLAKPTTRDQVRSLIRQVPFVPELQSATRLLVELRRRGTTMAVAVDEYGGTAGLITLEDVVEHIVGDIPGPLQPTQPPRVQKIDSMRWRVDGELSVEEWARAFRLRAPLEGINTIGGLVMARLGRVARVGDRTKISNLAIEVESMAGNRIETLVLQLAPPEPRNPGGHE